jgi:uncharacterized protein YodC (DUF2158 family)
MCEESKIFFNAG